MQKNLRQVNLLQKYIKNTEVHVGFAGGSGHLFKFVTENCGTYSITIYHDLVPDNPETAKSYKGLRRKLRKRERTIIVPVICTEYVILKSFGIVTELKDVVLNIRYLIMLNQQKVIISIC